MDGFEVSWSPDWSTDCGYGSTRSRPSGSLSRRGRGLCRRSLEAALLVSIGWISTGAIVPERAVRVSSLEH